MLRLICLFSLVLSVSCQRLRNEVDDLRLRCGEDAHLVDVAQWIEVFTDYGKPRASSVRASSISADLKPVPLPISSKGCIAVPEATQGWRWLAIRSEEGGVFGKVLRASPERYRRVQLEPVPGTFPRFDCPKPLQGDRVSSRDELSLTLAYPERWERENLIFQMDLKGVKGSVAPARRLELGSLDSDTVAFDIQKIPEGAYEAQLKLVNLLNLKDELKGFERTCLLEVDRTAPAVDIHLKGSTEAPVEGSTLRLGPGEAVEVQVKDASSTRVLSCWLERTSGQDQVCSDKAFVEAGNRLSTPREGEWELYFKAVDAAGNQSALKRYSVEVFDSEKIRFISGWIEEAKAFIGQNQPLKGLYRLARTLTAYSQLKSAAEKASIRAHILAPLLQILLNNAPYAQFDASAENVEAIFAVEGDRVVVVAGSIFNAGDSELKLMRVNGEIVRAIRFDEPYRFFYNATDRRFLAIKADGSYQVFDKDLILTDSGVGSPFPVNQYNRVPIREGLLGRSFAFSDQGAVYELDLVTAKVEKIRDGEFSTYRSQSGLWTVLRGTRELHFFNKTTGQTTTVAFEFDLGGVIVAEKADFLCAVGSPELRCASFADFAANKIYLTTSAAGKGLAVSHDGMRIGYAGREGVYLLDRQANTHFIKRFNGPIYRMFFDNELDLKIDSLGGRLSWQQIYDGFDTTSSTPVVTKKDEFWIPNTDIYVRTSGTAQNLFYADAAGMAKQSSQQIDLSGGIYARTLDGNFLVVANAKSIQVASLKVQIGEGFEQPCQSISFDGEHCALRGGGQLKIGRKVSSRGYQDYQMVEFPNAEPWTQILWNEVQPNRFAVWNGNELGFGVMNQGVAKLENRVDASIYAAKWLGGRFLAWVDESLKIYDTVNQRFIGDITGNAPTMFEPPVDFSTELNVFAAVVEDMGGTLLLKLVRAADGSELGRWQFKGKGREEADLVRFSADGSELLLGFHDGSVQLLSAKQIQLAQFEPRVIGQHADSVAAGGFMGERGRAFSLSLDGNLLFHDYLLGTSRLLQSNVVFPTNDEILYTGAVTSEGIIWSAEFGKLQIFDPSRKNIDTVTGATPYFRSHFLVSPKGASSAYLIDFGTMGYLKTLCDWLLPSIRNGIFKGEESPEPCL